MEYTIELFVDFLKEIELYSKDCESIREDAKQKRKQAKSRLDADVFGKKKSLEGTINESSNEKQGLLRTYEERIQKIENGDDSRRTSVTNRIIQCRACLSEIDTRISEHKKYLSNYASDIAPQQLTADAVISSMNAFADQVARLDNMSTSSKNYLSLAKEVKGFVDGATKALNAEITRMSRELMANQSQIDDMRKSSWQEYLQGMYEVNQRASSEQRTGLSAISTTRRKALGTLTEEEEKIAAECKQKIINRTEQFRRKYPPEEFEKEFFRIYADEPQIDAFLCKEVNPVNVRVSDLTYDFADLNLNEDALFLLNSDYFFLTKYRGGTARKGTIKAPYCVTFDKRFNYLFEVNNSNRQLMINRASSLAMRLFMMLPPNKINFTFFDPITLGETFASFTRLVEVDDRTSKVINGKIWTSEEDIEDKLRIATDHIANVTQRCLQGQYDNIQQYNIEAGQNAEPYQVLMVMDFPAGFNENSLRLMEQIIATGPKCGVYTVLLKSAEQYAKVDEKKLKPLVNNIMSDVSGFVAEGDKISFETVMYNNKRISFDIPSALGHDELDKVIPILKAGIKNAEKIVIPFEKIIPPRDDWFKGDCSSELSIPIGVHGANNIQNLTFGVGGSHHALVAGQTGAGKSSLLHTIIMSSLIKYPANQLQVFLVDFKRGVEFKIYANYSLENFKVVAIESEREFGCSVLEFLDREQSRRADMFKRLNVDNVEDYRSKSGEILPRILLIIDEFHVLFSKDSNDTMGKNSAAYLEQIIRQGRAFGIHIILASQTMTNIGGINNGVWGQVGVRIALKCPKSDAKFVLGNENDGVDLLSADNPGQAVYNSDCGNVIANTIFRVAYIEQDSQDEYLQYISSKSPRFGYPETRVMLSNVEDNIYNPLQKFKNGENVDFKDNSILVGEALKLVNNMRMVFKNKASSNMLVIGNDEQKARTLFTFASISMALHKLSVNGYKRPEKTPIYLLDYAPIEDFYEKDVLLELSKMLPHYIKYVPFDDANDVLAELYANFTQREKGFAEKEDTYLLVYGLQRARDLRSNNIYQAKNDLDDFDEFGSSTMQQLSVKPHEMFMNILQRGAAVGINSLVWEDNFKVFMAHYANMLSNFDMRIAFTMADEDSINYIEEPNGSKIGENGAIYSYNGNQKFRPYKKPDMDWLTQICERIESFE